MTPNKRRLGTTDLEITTVGFGAWAIGGGGWAYGWGPQDDAGSIAAIRHAVSRGVNWIDTAAIYGLGHSEEVVGRALREIRASERPYVFTKGGMIADRERPYDEPTRDLRPESIRREVEASLRRLGVERIDLYQFHWPDAVSTPIEESWREMGRLVDEGRVRAVGVSNFDVALLERAESVRHVDSVQPPFSLIRRDAAADVVPWAAAHGTGVLVYSPMQSGLLTDTFSAKRLDAMADEDWRRRSGRVQGAERLAQHRSPRRTATDRRTPQRDDFRRVSRMGARVARCDRRHRRRTQPRPGGRLDRRGVPRSRRIRSRGDRRRDPADR
jgi:aryl-alcohol dehydrogenase-like predicted oxidoreductase